MSNVAINIAAEFTGKKAFAQAETSVGKLNNSVHSLAKTMGVALSARAVYQFGKAAVKAFSEDQKAATQLTQTMKNLGLELSAPSMGKFIDQMTLATGVADNELRPAMQALLQTTGSIAMSQKLLTQALDVSASSGVNLTQVSTDLAQAYVGNLKGLRKYNLGLTQAELKTKSFAELTDLLSQKFGGALQANMTTTAGKMQVLANAAGEAQEKIGAGLVDAFARAGGGTEIEDAIESMNTMADSINNVSAALGSLFWVFKKGYDIWSFISNLGGLTGTKGKLFGLDKIPAQNKAGAFVGGMSGTVGSAINQGRIIAEAKAEKDALLRAKAITAELNKQNKLKKDQLALTKASAILSEANKLFDNERIQLAAAMQGKITEEDKVRVKLKQDILNLEQAIQNNNVAAAASFANAIVQDSQKLQMLRGDMQGLNDIENPFNAWLETIRQMAAELARLANIPIIGAAMSSTHVGGTGLADWGAAAYEMPKNPLAGTYYGETGRDPMPINLTITGGDAVTRAIQFNLQDNSLSGSFAQINRADSSYV